MDSSPENPNSLSDQEKWKILARHEKLGEVLLKHGKLTLSQLHDLIQEQANSDIYLGELIVSKGLMSRQELLEALDWQHKADRVTLESLIDLKDKHKEP